MLGTGSFGDVYLGEESNRETNKKRDVAIKKVPFEKYSPEHYKYLLAEIDIMSGCKCENIVSLQTTIEVPRKELYLVMELCEANFKYYIKQQMKKGRAQRKPFLEEKEIQYWMKQIVNGMKYLHLEKRVCHRDIKPHNLLLKRKGDDVVFDFFSKPRNFNEYTVLISDFGLSKYLEDDLVTGTIVGTKCYKSPQIALGELYSFDADIFALGVVLFEMIAGYCIFGTDKQITRPKFGECISTLTENVDWSFLLEELDFSSELLELLAGMLAYDAKKRLSIEQVADHDFFKLVF